MNDKERLEKIKEKVNSLLYLGDNEGNGEVNINAIYNDMSWLIEQAEKAEKYREALEFYANEKSWMNREVTILMDGEPTDVEDCPAIFDDGGNIARKALEGEK